MSRLPAHEKPQVTSIICRRYSASKEHLKTLTEQIARFNGNGSLPLHYNEPPQMENAILVGLYSQCVIVREFKRTIRDRDRRSSAAAHAHQFLLNIEGYNK